MTQLNGQQVKIEGKLSWYQDTNQQILGKNSKLKPVFTIENFDNSGYCKNLLKKSEKMP